MKVIQHVIDGVERDDHSGAWGDVSDPAYGKVSGTVALGDGAAVSEAVASAKRVQREWAATSLGRRQQVLLNLVSVINDKTHELAEIVSSEHGKTLADARGEINAGLEVAKFASGIPHLMKGDFSENVSVGIDTFSIRQPLGVVAGITPFNFPVMVPMWMFPVAIACGNAFILKPSEKDPSASNFLASLALDAGVPPGVLNVVHGGKDAVDAILADAGIAAVSFVGSTPVARYVYETAARNGKRVQALGGAKNHLIVMPDADMDAAADALVSSAYGSAGERCMAISVAVAVGDAGDKLRDKLVNRIQGLVVSDGREPGTDVGPLVTRQHLDHVRSLISEGEAAGASLVVDGRDIVVNDRPDGFFAAPTLFDHVTTEMSIYREEIFGPVLSMLRVESLNDAMRMVRDNPYGNGVSLFTQSGAAARAFQTEIDAGMVGINVPIPIPIPYYSFGGWKNSLFGDSGQYGEDGIRFYTRRKVVTSRWSMPVPGLDLRFPGDSSVNGA